ncbi:MAG: hypothetical protein CVU29_10140 [Betaproteobacteria bacterium HGW-Betaproteobacteria-22]|nr:MAG: hypothetical protein CVU29_10140 [Betaproteobacteria bacterium HGW-Betaproteobacteria-22]
MSWESIGSVSTGDMPDDRVWILWSLRLAKKYIELVCGNAPEGSKLDVMWNDHEFGSYPTLGVWSDYNQPWDYINRCEHALEVFDNAVSWDKLRGYLNDEDDDEDAEEGDDDTEYSVSSYNPDETKD